MEEGNDRISDNCKTSSLAIGKRGEHIMYCCLKLTFRQYPAIHTNYSLSNYHFKLQSVDIFKSI